jgi:hypothetical protein
MKADWPIFDFETDVSGTLQCIPMCVRFKLDLSGVKLSLKQWNQFSHEEREHLVGECCDTPEQVQAYRTRLVALIESRGSSRADSVEIEQHPPWNDANRVPSRIKDHANGLGVSPPTLLQWAGLTPSRRFALFKLTRPGHDNENFLPAMREFGLIQ